MDVGACRFDIIVDRYLACYVDVKVINEICVVDCTIALSHLSTPVVVTVK